METITIKIFQNDVYEEVAKATDYIGSKSTGGDDDARDRILAADEDLADLGRFWEESVLATNENLKEMLVSGKTTHIDTLIPADQRPVVTTTRSEISTKTVYEAVIEVSKSFDKTLSASVESTLRSFFIASIIGQWFKFANKGEAQDYFTQAAEMMEAAERLLYSRKKPTRPTD